MQFLRKRHEVIEHAWMTDTPSSVDRGNALHTLGGAVILVGHPYDRHPKSGSGNCWCGRDQSNQIHNVIVKE